MAGVRYLLDSALYRPQRTQRAQREANLLTRIFFLKTQSFPSLLEQILLSPPLARPALSSRNSLCSLCPLW
jgi:hypothetical protein